MSPRHEVSDLARAERLDRGHAGAEEAELLGLEDGAERHRLERLPPREGAVDHAHEGDDAAVLVVGGVEDERPRRRIRVAGGRVDALDHRVEHGFDSLPRLGRDRQHVLGLVAEQVRHLERRALGIGLGQVDLVQHRDDLEVVLDRQVGVGERLRLDTLRRVDDQQGALAGLQGARDLVGEVDVPGRVDQVELVALPLHAHRLGLDRDPALALQLHRVEHLLAHLALGDGVRQLEDAVGQRRLAVVDVGDDREVADVLLIHASSGPAEAASQRK